jgi:hypothetical protein
VTFEATHRRILGYALIAISIAMAAYHIWAIAFGTPEAVLFRGTHLLFAIVLTFLSIAGPSPRPTGRDRTSSGRRTSGCQPCSITV